ncbi:MAG: ATP-binding cassette domain-containing protein [Desulfarculus sp.]|nr:ATP-binding cassette domain-containing protein [Desulfarculus sp.]
MALINLFDVSLAFGGPLLLDRVSFRVEPGERVCLLGRNGAGKSSLLKLLAGLLPPQSGEVSRALGLRTSYLSQDVPGGLAGQVQQVAAGGQEAGPGLEPEAWRTEHQLRAMLSRLGLEPQARVETLSGGLQRRVLLAQALAAGPGLLLLDEPTNHLDIESIVWLEQYLSGYPGAMVFVSHDRAFARNLATRVVELDRGQIFDWNCPYDQFVQRREDALLTEQEQRARFDKKMAQEEEWLHRGVKARRTRDEGRVRRLMDMRAERAKRREVLGSARLRAQLAGLSGKVVAEAQEVTFAYEAAPVIRDFSTLILRGDKISIIGPNGSGKTTLLKVLLGQLSPQAGQVRQGANLEMAYFDQMRQELDLDQTVQENLAVSGGERNRLLLAKLFAKPANLLVLDEPTNDLDQDTLGLLENLLVEFEGTVLLVSHDRQFLNNVAAGTLVMEGHGRVGEYAGGYDDWLAQRRPQQEQAPVKPKAAKRVKSPPPAGQRGLSFQQRRDLEDLPRRIEDMEREQALLLNKVADPALYAKAGRQVTAISARLAELESEMEEAFAQWEELERLAQPRP